MVAHDISSLLQTLNEAVLFNAESHDTLGSYNLYQCPYCQLKGLSEAEMWFHIPAYHINWPNNVPVTDICPICNDYYNKPLQVHIHSRHGPLVHRAQELRQSKVLTQLYSFALVVCRHPMTKKYLLCQEFSNQGYWLPGGNHLN